MPPFNSQTGRGCRTIAKPLKGDLPSKGKA
jgi:hypothetical protein